MQSTSQQLCSNSSQASTPWTCDVCTQPFQDLMFLPCSHKYCERCLRVWVGVYVDSYRSGRQEFPCRVCWHFFIIPQEGGINAYRQSYVVDSLGLDLAGMSMDTGSDEQLEIDSSNCKYTTMGAVTESDVTNSNKQCGDTMADVVDNMNDLSRHWQNGAVHVTQLNQNQSMSSACDSIIMPAGSADTSSTQLQCAGAPDNMDMTSSVDSTLLPVADSASLLNMHEGNAHRRRLCFPSCHTYMYHIM